MGNQHLSEKLLDTAINAMGRNRTLLFTINLIAALIFVVVYLERFSFDMKQGEGHLIAYQGRCRELNQALTFVPHWAEVSEEDKRSFSGCSDLDKIRTFVITNSNDSTLLETISRQIYRLHIIQNEINSARLATGSIVPLGIGLPIPRNDMVIICGFLMLILYAWLAFSFEQLARITAKIKQLFPEDHAEEGKGTRTSVSDLVDINFLFRTDEGGTASFFVKVLYLLAPLSMSIATFNNLFLNTTKSFKDYLNDILQIPLMIQAMIVIALWIIGYHVTKSDKKVNKASMSPDEAQEHK